VLLPRLRDPVATAMRVIAAGRHESTKPLPSECPTPTVSTSFERPFPGMSEHPLGRADQVGTPGLVGGRVDDGGDVGQRHAP
jgi:hypothetical protein